LRRTAKPCGPEAPTLASSSRETSFSGMMVARKPGHQGEYGISRKTIAQGMPDVSGEPVVTNACAFYTYTRGCGCIERPAFPVPSVWSRAENLGTTRAHRAARSRRRICTVRHAWPCAGHPRLSGASTRKTWMAGTSPAMTNKPLLSTAPARTFRAEWGRGGNPDYGRGAAAPRRRAQRPGRGSVRADAKYN
jgi:hypothetical protein